MVEVEEILEKLEKIVAKELKDKKKAEEIMDLLYKSMESFQQTTLEVVENEANGRKLSIIHLIKNHRHLEDGTVVIPLK
jgi:hypothetical protein